MKPTMKFLLSILLILTSIQLGAKSPHKLFTFVQLTDIQMGMISNNKNCVEEIRLYSLAIQEINRLKPAFVVITGDFVNNRTDTSQLCAYERVTSTISKKIPVYYIPGNHDVGAKPTAETLDYYFNNYATYKFSFIKRNIQFIGINSSLINSGIEAEKNQWDWLKKVLAENSKASYKVVFSHHPFFINDFNEKDAYSNIPQPKREEYMKLFKNSNVNMILAGHYHNNAQASYDGIEMITTSAVGKPLGKIKSGFRVVTVYKLGIEQQYVEIE